MDGSRHPTPSAWLQDALSFSPDVPSQLLFLAPPDPFLETLLFLPGNLTHLLNFISHFSTLNPLIQGSANVFCKGPDRNYLKVCRGFLGGPVVKKPSCNGLIPGLRRSLGVGNGNPLQCSCLGNSMNRGAWWATVHGVAKSQMQLSIYT